MMMLIYTKGKELCQYKVWGRNVYKRNGEKIYYIKNAGEKGVNLDLEKYSKNSRVLYDNDENIKYVVDGGYVYEYGSTDWKYKVEKKRIYEKDNEGCVAEIGYSIERRVRRFEKMYTQSELEKFRKEHKFSEVYDTPGKVIFEAEDSLPYPKVADIEEVLYKGSTVMIACGEGKYKGFVDDYAPEALEKNYGSTTGDFIYDIYGDIDLYFDEGITKIADAVNGYGVFCSMAIVHVLLPSTIEEIGTYAFKDCDSLESIIIPEGLKFIRKGAFENCESLKSIELPSTIEVIDEDAFYGCGDIEIKINKPEGSVAGAPWRADDAKVIWAK